MTIPAEPTPSTAQSGEGTTTQAGRADRDYWLDRDWDGEPDDPSDHYYC